MCRSATNDAPVMNKVLCCEERFGKFAWTLHGNLVRGVQFHDGRVRDACRHSTLARGSYQAIVTQNHVSDRTRQITQFQRNRLSQHSQRQRSEMTYCLRLLHIVQSPAPITVDRADGYRYIPTRQGAEGTAQTDHCPDGGGICRSSRPTVARDYASHEDDPAGFYRHLRGSQQCHCAPQFVADQGEIPKIFLFRDASNGLDAFRHIDHRNVLGDVCSMSWQIDGSDANGLPGQKQTGGMLGGSGHVPPNFSPTPSALTRTVY